MSLQDIDLKEEYRSDRNDIVVEFFFPCLSNCIEYARCVDYLSLHSMTTIALGFDNFTSGKANIRMITGHRFGTRDLEILQKLFSNKSNTLFSSPLDRNIKLQKLQEFVMRGQLELKVAIPNSEQVAESFSERIGIFRDAEGNTVAFTGTSGESFSTQTRDFESVDVFTSWNDRSRVETKVNDFENLWINKTKYVEVYDFVLAQQNNLLKFSTGWIFDD